MLITNIYEQYRKWQETELKWAVPVSFDQLSRILHISQESFCVTPRFASIISY